MALHTAHQRAAVDVLRRFVEVRDLVRGLRAARRGASERALNDATLAHGSTPPGISASCLALSTPVLRAPQHPPLGRTGVTTGAPLWPRPISSIWMVSASPALREPRPADDVAHRLSGPYHSAPIAETGSDTFSVELAYHPT